MPVDPDAYDIGSVGPPPSSTPPFDPTGGYQQPSHTHADFVPPYEGNWVELPPGSGHWVDVSPGGQSVNMPEVVPHTYTPGGNNANYWAWSTAQTDASPWTDRLRALLETEIASVARLWEQNPEPYMGLFTTLLPQLYNYIDSEHIWPMREAGYVDSAGLTVFENSYMGMGLLLRAAKAWLGARIPQLQMGWEAIGNGARPPSHGGGGGAAQPQYDLEQIAASVTNLWRAYLREEPGDPRGVARAFVSAWLENPATDLKTFVLGQMRGTGRWTDMYQFKPAGMDELEYQQPYIQAASALLKPGEVTGVAVGGMRLGADQASFSARLMHHPTVQKSSGFISAMEQRINDMRGVLR